MPELPDDHVDSIKQGTYVYWLNQDDDIPRGTVGEVIEVDGDEVKVEFDGKKLKVLSTELNVSDFQKGTYVHSSQDGVADKMIGQVKGVEDGKLKIEMEGETIKEKPKYLIKCDFQIGMFAFWNMSDDDIAPGHVGQVLDDLNEKGKVKVSFPKGSWRFRPRDLVRCNVQPGSYVQWTESDDDIADGELGEVTGEVNDSGKVKVAFRKGTWSFKTDQLILYELQLGAFVKWQKIDEDVKKGELGQVVGIKVSQGRLRVQFPKGRWKFKANELSMCKIQPGQLVLWKQDDEDIPRGDIGEVIRLAGDGKKFSIQWPKGHWSMRIMEIEKLQFQKGDRVQWIKSDDDIPEGAIGVVMCVKYVEDSGQKLYVNFPSGRYSFWPHTLEAVNFDTDGAQQLKLTFKRFDANGDGKLSEEEFMSVLGKLGGGGGGLAPEECKQLFDALDKDDNGKLTVNEFIDYVLSDASQAAKMVLADGFGFDGLLGISDDEDDYDDEADEAGMKGRPCEEAPPLKSSYNPETSEGVDAETEVSKAEWATAMLTVGIPRAAALASFEAVVEELGGNQEVLRLEDLACELNGMGGAAGVEELRGPVGKVKHGEVEIVDLGTPSEEVDFERDLARKTGLDGLVFDLHYNNHSPQDAFKHLPKAKLSALERNILGEMSEEELVEAVLCYWESSATLSAVASWQRCRENCLREVQEIIDECKSRGEKYRDESFDPLENEGKVLWVDKKKPGWDNSVTQPDGWTSATEVVGVRHPCIHKKGASASDVEQGHIGNCFFVAAVAAMAGTRRSFLRQALVAYDMEVGVYGVMFCEEMHFVYEIVDDLIGTKSKHRFLYARSAEDLEELWVPIIEKAFFKHMTCLEMCDGGQSFEVIQSFLGGVWGQYHAGRKSHNLWDKVDRGCENGEVLTTSFVKPSKGPYANVEGEDGRCGEPGIGMGLVEGHAYSLLRSGEVDGHRLICSRNPWASHEWTGPWSDASNKWNDERRKKLGLKKRNDGTFWMEDKDFVQLSKGVKFNRTFGPTWQCCAQYGRFGKEPPFTALAKRSYRACEDGEINLTRGEKLEVTGNSGKWLYGVNKTTGKEGYFRSSDVDMRCEDTFKYELTFESVAEDARITVGVFRQDQIKCREWYKRKQDGQHYKDKYYPQADLHIYGSDGSRITKVTLGKRDRSEWYSLKPSLGPFKVYVSCKATKGRRFALYAFAPHGELRWKRLDCERSRWIAEVGEQMEMDNMRENIYSQASEALDDYIHLGYSLMKDYPGVASQVMDVAHTVGDLMNAGGVQQAADRVRDFVDSDQVQNLTNQVKDLMNSDQAQGMVDQVGGLMNRAKSLWG